MSWQLIAAVAKYKISKFGKKKQIKFKIHAIALQQNTLWSHYEKCKEIFLAMKVKNIILLSKEKKPFSSKKISPITFYLDVTLGVQH